METHDISPSLLVIGAREHTINKLQTLNISYVLIQNQQDPVNGYDDATIIYINSYENMAELSALAQQLHQRHHFKAVVSFTEFGLYPAAVLAEQLQLKGNAVFPVEYTRDKFKMRRLLEKHKLNTIAYQHCSSLNDVVGFYEKIKAPFILKPIAGAGSQGVCYVDSQAMITTAWNWAIEHGSDYLIAEEYLLGKEYSVESLSLDGQHEVIAITEKLTTNAPHFIELGHYTPARLNPAMQQKIHVFIGQFLALIQQQNGPAHTEIKLYEDEIKIIESQTRMGGDQIWELTELTTGIDVISETIIHLLSLSKKPRIKKAKAAAVLFFAREYEEILDIEGINSAQNLPGIMRIHCTMKKGHKLGKLISSTSRQGYILGIGKHSDAAIASVHQAMDEVRIKSKIHHQ